MSKLNIIAENITALTGAYFYLATGFMALAIPFIASLYIVELAQEGTIHYLMPGAMFLVALGWIILLWVKLGKRTVRLFNSHPFAAAFYVLSIIVPMVSWQGHNGFGWSWYAGGTALVAAALFSAFGLVVYIKWRKRRLNAHHS